MPVSKYFEADITILGFPILHVRFLVVKDPNTLLEPQHTTQLPGVVDCNVIWLGCEEFGRVHGFDSFEEFSCPQGVHPVVLAQLCFYCHQNKLQNQTGSTSTNQTNVSSSGISSKAKKKKTLVQVQM